MIAEVFLDTVKLQLARAIKAYAVKHGMNQTDMSYLLDTSQPRVSNVFNERLHNISVDQLIKWAYDVGIAVSIQTN